MFKTSALFLKKHIERPKVAVLLGSGLGDAMPKLKKCFSVPYAKIPGFPKTGVKGHKGQAVFGYAPDGTAVIVFCGRFHLYEGFSPMTASAPVWVAHRLGAKYFFQVSAAGGISPRLASGDIMLAKDHLNFSFKDPLFEISSKRKKTVFLDINDLYDKKLQKVCLSASRKTRVPIKSGVVAMMHGPCYETSAEIRMLSRLGADSVCMSGVPEAITAHYLGLKILWLTVITNRAGCKTSHKSVLSAAEKSSPRVSKLFAAIVGRIGNNR